MIYDPILSDESGVLNNLSLKSMYINRKIRMRDTRDSGN